MFDRLADDAKSALNKARQQSQRLNHDYLGTEHLLLGLLEVEGGRARSVLKSLQIDTNRLRSEIDALVRPGSTRTKMGQIPFTPRARKALEYSMEEAASLGTKVIGTEHLLLGLVREPEGVASKALSACGLSFENARALLRDEAGVEATEGTGQRLTGAGDGRSEAWRVRVLEEAVDVLVELQESELAARMRELARKHGSRKWER
jgi:ATP-dependent Clp protease ATP-binding subunit ClpC